MKKTEKLNKSFKRIIKIIKKPEMVILPGNIAYAIVLSIFPAIIVLAFIVSLFNLNNSDILNNIALNMPKDTYELLSNFLSNESSNLALITFLSGIFFASSGTKSIIVAANMLYKVEEKNVIKMTLKSLLLVVVLMLLFMFTILILGYGTTILDHIFKYFNLNDRTVYSLFNIFKWPVSFGLIFISTKIIYIIAPSVKVKNVNKGSLFTTIGWMISTSIYSIYVANFARYDVFYGSLSSIVVLMIWIYILSYILVIGIAINADTYKN